ncbi:hypothetical protein [Tenacibaculum sp. SZ-18]|nr:hypothetical protein [Tenacibaculum sp. SZ-18]
MSSFKTIILFKSMFYSKAENHFSDNKPYQSVVDIIHNLEKTSGFKVI